jgi:hypothetical protein
MAVRSAFAKIKNGYFLHVKMAAAEKDTHYCRDEDRENSSDKIPPMLEGIELALTAAFEPYYSLHPGFKGIIYKSCNPKIPSPLLGILVFKVFN